MELGLHWRTYLATHTEFEHRVWLEFLILKNNPDTLKQAQLKAARARAEPGTDMPPIVTKEMIERFNKTRWEMGLKKDAGSRAS
jgi:hypothetical protein